VTSRGPAGESPAGPRVGLFGLLGSGNIGNDASMDSVLAYLSRDHPDAIVDAMCMGPDRVRAVQGIDAIRLQWGSQVPPGVPGPVRAVAKIAGKGVDAFRTVAWVRKHDLVIVPGMGVMETSTPIRPWGVPYAMFLLSAAGRLTRTKVALVSVGATPIKQRGTKWMFNSAARLASYRSYRDPGSKQAMTGRGIDTTNDPVYPDLVFGIPPLTTEPGDPQTVVVGVMAYYGTNDHRKQADQIHSAYVAGMQRFVRWLVQNGRRVRLTVGDASDQEVVDAILADVRGYEPDPDKVTAEPVKSFADLMRAMAPAGTVVAVRYHNVMCGLKLGKPVISLGYSGKNTSLMADMQMSEFSQFAHSLDVDLLIKQFSELEARTAELRTTIMSRNEANASLLDEQFALLSKLLFPA
jgi:polysaccharide pyruvyl transferase WcaK-like protein